MVLSTLILDTHYGSVSKPGSLAFFIALLGRKRLNPKEKPCYYSLKHKWIPSDLYQEHNNLLIKRTHATVGFKWSTMDYITPLIRLFHKIASIFDEQFELPEINQYHKIASRENDILDVANSLEEHEILAQELCPFKHQCGPMGSVSVVKDLMEEGLIKLVDRGYNNFLQRMEQQSTMDGAILEHDIDLFDDELMDNLDGEINQAEKYLDALFN
ncbi:hypothetical protein EC991_009686 [Linnemannia zychae]|nr:hypothetical protein EC991_009686 [Linnemannia zychae]